MNIYGLIGYPLTHSFSEKYFSEKFAREKISDTVYNNFPLENIIGLAHLIENNPDLRGLNVTIPYKEQVIPFLSSLEGSAAVIKAVNTLKFIRTNKGLTIKGFNTDEYGFSHSLEPLLKKKIHTHALILGTGGSAKAVEYTLKRWYITYNYVSRSPKEGVFSYSQLNGEIMKKYKLIINTSPVGMYPNVENCPAIPYEHIGCDHVLFDLIYNPEETRFLTLGKNMGATIKNGLEMLHLQAERAWEIWNEPNL